MIPVQGFDGHRVAVLGLGRSGLATARALREGGAEALCWDDGAAGRAAAEAEGLAIWDPMAPGAFEGIASLIVSPGIPHLYPAPHRAIAAAWAAGVPVDNDVGLFFRSLGLQGWDEMEEPPKVVAVTGSNGKSTTSALIAHILTVAGKSVQLAGNIGRGCARPSTRPRRGAWWVLKLSSYQIDHCPRAGSRIVAVFTNLSPDHSGPGMAGRVVIFFAAGARALHHGRAHRAVISAWTEDEGRTSPTA